MMILQKCWLWIASSGSHGYGQFRIGRRIVLAHRVAYELLVDSIPEGMTIDHVKAWGCTSQLCVNPNHLEVVSQGVNTLRGNGQAALNA